MDDDGDFWHWIAGAVVGVVTQYVSDVTTNLIEGKSFVEALKPTSTWADYGSAAISGVFAASGIGIGGAMSVNAALGGTTYLANCAIKGETANWTDFGLATGVGAVSGLVGGSGANGTKLRGIVSTSRRVLKTAVSPKKIAMYTSKISNAQKTAIVSTFRTISAGLIANKLNNKRKFYTGSIS